MSLPGGGGGTGSDSSTAAASSIATGSIVDILRADLVEIGEEGVKALADARAQRIAIARNMIIFDFWVSYNTVYRKLMTRYHFPPSRYGCPCFLVGWLV